MSFPFRERVLRTFKECLSSASAMSKAVHNEGYRVRFVTKPTLSRPSDHPQGIQDEVLDGKWQDLVHKGIARIITDNSLGYYSHSFVIPKKNKKELRLISDLRTLNSHILHKHFKMNSLSSALSNIQKLVWFISFDIEDGYFNVPIRRNDTKYFRFRVGTTTYELLKLPMGFVGSAAAFSSWLRPFLDTLRTLFPSIYFHNYSDDCLGILPRMSPMRARDMGRRVLQTIEILQLPIKVAKSTFKPSRTTVFLGFSIDSRSQSISVPSSKSKTVCKQIRKCIRLADRQRLRLNVLASTIGQVIALLPAVAEGRLHVSYLYSLQTDLVNQFGWNHYATISLSLQARTELHWWESFLSRLRHRPIYSRFSSHELRVVATDASDFAIAGTLISDPSLPYWYRYLSRRERGYRINLKELMAVWESLCIYSSSLSGSHINIRSDSSTVVSALNKWGSRDKTLHPLLRTIFTWAIRTDTLITATYIPTLSNVVADTLSRGRELSPSMFREMHFLNNTIKHSGHLEWTLSPYFSRLIARMFRCRKASIAFPTNTSQVGEFLRRAHETRSKSIIVIPLWPASPWFNLAAQMAASLPVILPPSSFKVKNQLKPSYPRWGWIGFRLSASKRKRTLFRNQLRFSSASTQRPRSSTVMGGRISPAMFRRLQTYCSRFLATAIKAKF